MKNIKNIVKYMRKRSEELKGVSMVIPVSKPLWDHIADVLDSYGWKKGSPEKSGQYLCLTENKIVDVIHYSKKHNVFNAFDEDHDVLYAINVIAWCELPELPEELSK